MLLSYILFLHVINSMCYFLKFKQLSFKDILKMKKYLYIHIFPISETLYFFYVDTNSIWHHFSFCLKSFLSYFYSSSMLVMNYLTFFKNYFLKNVFLYIEFWVDEFFFSTLNVSLHCFLTCIIPNKMSITILFFLLK